MYVLIIYLGVYVLIIYLGDTISSRDGGLFCVCFALCGVTSSELMYFLGVLVKSQRR